MKKIIFPLLAAVLFCLSVSAQKKKDISTPVTVNYCLPKVSFKVVVTLECVKQVPGPYREQAVAKLGLKPEVTTSGEEWTIKDIAVKPFFVPDEKAIYAITASGDYHSVMLSLSAEGFLAGVNSMQALPGVQPELLVYRQPEAFDKVIDIINLNTYNHLKEVLDSNYTVQEIDGVKKKIWDPIERYVPKTNQDNIDEAVREIFRIRSERVRLLGAENQIPDGQSLDIILKQFDLMEENYLSLFMGKKEKETIVKEFICTPEKENEPVVAFRFSSENGVAAKKDVSAVAYTLQVQNVVIPGVTSTAASATQQSAIYYRVPAVAELKLMRASDELMSFKTVIPQLGEIRIFPTEVISNEGLSLEFYPQYGSLKSVNKK